MREINRPAVALLLLVSACGPGHRGGGGGDGGTTNQTPCEAALDHPSNVGCDFWAVDLDNEAFSLAGGIGNDAASQQFAIVVANDNGDDVTITVTQDAARVGDPLNEQVVTTATVPPHAATRIDLPQREVDGSMGQNGSYVANSGPGTFVSPHAYHVVASEPVVVYQFNPIVQAYSNDASTLIPIQALGTYYVVIGWNTANPCGLAGMHIDSIPDHTFVTIIPTADDTDVTVTTTHAIAASGGDSGLAIAQTAKGGTVTMNLSRYSVANLESYQPDNASFTDCVNAGDGDFTGTEVRANKPIVVFTGGERGIGFGGADNVVYPPDWDSSTDSICCTDHLEEQLLPVTAFGKDFALARSPIRSTDPTGWKEPDLVRVLATVDGTNVTTNAPAPYDHFTLNAREQKTFASTTGLAISADQAIEVATYLVSQQFVKHGWTGDPSQLLVTPAEQFRQDYVFLVPPSWSANYAVFAKPTTATITFDGMPLAAVAGCVTAPIGTVAGASYEQVTCPATEGQHVATGDQAFGIAVYGWHSVGSYAFVGGSDVNIINPIQ